MFACELSVQMIMWDEFLSGCEKSVALKGPTLQGAGCGRRLLSPVVYACAHVGPVHSLCDSSDLYTE